MPRDRDADRAKVLDALWKYTLDEVTDPGPVSAFTLSGYITLMGARGMSPGYVGKLLVELSKNDGPVFELDMGRSKQYELRKRILIERIRMLEAMVD